MGLKLRCMIWVSIISCLAPSICGADDPSPKPWPEQFHANLFQETAAGAISEVDLWYDWPNGRNYNIIQHQLSYKMYDVEWTNGTSYYFDLAAKTCKVYLFPVGILRPDWLADSTYLGVEKYDGFTCNVWTKEDFITYYEDVDTQKPVGWFFWVNSMTIHVITYEVGAVLGDSIWQAPSYCFEGTTDTAEVSENMLSSIKLPSADYGNWNEPWKRWLTTVS